MLCRVYCMLNIPQITTMNYKSTAYCKVCHDAGKTKAEYTSHYVKQTPAPDSKIACPYLLSIECAYCRQKGHTPKYCNMIKNKVKTQKMAAPPPPPTQKMDAPPTPPPPQKMSELDVYPVLNTAVVSINAPVLTNWAAVVSKPVAAKPIPPAKVRFSDTVTEFIACPEKSAQRIILKTCIDTPDENPAQRFINWADTDSEDEN